MVNDDPKTLKKFLSHSIDAALKHQKDNKLEDYRFKLTFEQQLIHVYSPHCAPEEVFVNTIEYTPKENVNV